MSQGALCETSRDHNRISVYNVWGLTEEITILVDHYSGLIFIRMILSRFVKTAFCALVATCGVSVLGFAQDFSLTVEATPAVTEGMTQYRFYVNMNEANRCCVWQQRALSLKRLKGHSTALSIRAGMRRASTPRLCRCSRNWWTTPTPPLVWKVPHHPQDWRARPTPALWRTATSPSHRSS